MHVPIASKLLEIFEKFVEQRKKSKQETILQFDAIHQAIKSKDALER